VPQLERYFSLSHPTAEGHFPGNPIIPGALLLADVLDTLCAELRKSRGPCRIKSAKFLSPARPGDRIVVDYALSEAGSIRFSCSVEGRLVMTGDAECEG
jgi:3-hydroxyacyl-[acyl-carrier-protein] dehydratase